MFDPEILLICLALLLGTAGMVYMLFVIDFFWRLARRKGYLLTDLIRKK